MVKMELVGEVQAKAANHGSPVTTRPLANPQPRPIGFLGRHPHLRPLFYRIPGAKVRRTR